MSETLADRIDALLPQTQCRQCGYPGCRPYSEAVATGRASINQCPPGGEETIRELAALLGRAFEPLNPAFGTTKPPMAAVIDEAVCIAMVVTDPAASRRERAALARRRYLARSDRLEREKAERDAGVAASRNDAAERRKRDTIERVMQRARERLRSRTR